MSTEIKLIDFGVLRVSWFSHIESKQGLKYLTFLKLLKTFTLRSTSSCNLLFMFISSGSCIPFVLF